MTATQLPKFKFFDHLQVLLPTKEFQVVPFIVYKTKTNNENSYPFYSSGRPANLVQQ